MAFSGGPIPVGYLSTVEAFEKYRRAKRGDSVDTHPVFGSAEWEPWRQLISAQLDTDEATFNDVISSGALEVLVRAQDGSDYRITPHDIAESRWPSRMFLSPVIQTFPDDALAKYNGLTPMVELNSFNSWLLATSLPTPEFRIADIDAEQISMWTPAQAAAWIAWKVANRVGHSTLGDILSLERTIGENSILIEQIEKGWLELLEALKEGTIRASSRDVDEIGSAIWRYAELHFYFRGNLLSDRFVRQRTLQRNEEVHTDVLIDAASVKANWPLQHVAKALHSNKVDAAVSKKGSVHALAKLAISAIWPDGCPPELRAKDRDNKILEWCKAQGYQAPPSVRTIRTALKTLRMLPEKNN